MSDGDDTLGFCAKCFLDIGKEGTLLCRGLDREFNAPLVAMYHRVCYSELTEQEKPHCTDCVSNPCFIRRKKLE